jgi:hypothetical protein
VLAQLLLQAARCIFGRQLLLASLLPLLHQLPPLIGQLPLELGGSA